MLVRRFIGRRLAEYYAQPAHKVVGRSTELDAVMSGGGDSNLLSSLSGEWHWKRVFRRVYEEREGHWLTPIELFQPHYSYVLGDFCARYHETMTESMATERESDRSSDHDGGATERESEREPSSDAASETSDVLPFEIVEVGGGRGTNANWILSYLRENKPRVYSSLTSYTLVDSSPSLHKTQMDRFSEGPHSGKVRFELKDMMDVAEGTTALMPKSDIPTVVLGMELLDNLPHDKIRGRMRHKLEQAEVVASQHDGTDTNKKQQQRRERFVPLSDPLLKRILRKVPQLYTQQSASESASYTDSRWVPSIACGVLQHAIHQRPQLGLVLADFDWLPAPDLEPDDGGGAHRRLSNEAVANWSPIVTDMEGTDHESYLTAPPRCDILFPTDFELLESFVRRCLPRVDPGSALPEDARLDASEPAAVPPRRPNNEGPAPVGPPVVRVEKQALFLERWGPQHVASTKSWLTGHTPLLHDFANCSVLTISREQPGTKR